MKYLVQLMSSKLFAMVVALVVTACSSTPEKVVLQSLMTEELEGVDGTEVIVSRVDIPPNTTLPKHWHPGEEFVYVMEGSATLWQKDKPEVTVKAGEVVKVPLKQVHTAITSKDGVKLLVFRVHEQGKPERVLVE